MDNNIFYITFQTGDKAIAINNNDGNIYFNSLNQIELKSLEMASVGLETWKSDILDEHFEREEVKEIFSWINEKANKPKDRISVVVGNAGMGKSVVMSDILKKLEAQKIPVLGIKLDQLNFNTSHELNDAVDLGEGRSIVSVYKELDKQYEKSVLLIDQIDALSLSLSTDRRAINVASRLIEQINKFSNVKIVISCRKFDLDYDYTLQGYNRYKKIYVSNLSDENVKLILEKLRVDYQRVSERTRRFLSVPINLYLFSLVNKPELLNGETLTLQKLYDELWRKVILRSDERQGLNDFLELVVKRMYDDQTLAVSGRLYEDSYSDQMKYLLSENFMVGSIREKIQFLHQSLFDYTYARKFVESGISIFDELQREHQGLFIRSRVRQVLLYMRDTNLKQYLATLNKILFAEKSNGEFVVRFHIKMVVLNSLGFCEGVSSEETKYFLDHVLVNKTLAPLFIDSVYSRDWFRIITEKSIWRDVFINGDESAIALISSMCQKVFSLDEELVEAYLDKLLSLNFEKVRKPVFKILCNIGRFGKNKNRLLELYKETNPQESFPDGYGFLRYILKYNPEFVEEELEKHVDNVVSDFKHGPSDRFSMGYEPETLYTDLKQYAPKLAYKLSLFSVSKVFDKTVFPLKEDGLLGSWEFYTYERHRGLIGHDITDMYDYVLDVIEKEAQEAPEDIKEQLASFLISKRTSDILIAIIGYTANVDFFKNEIFKLLTNADWLAKVLDFSSVLDYYIKLLFKASFMIYDKPDQEKILSTLQSLHPSWETMLFKEHTKYGQPLTSKGKTFAKFIELLDDKDYLKNNFPVMYREYVKLKDKYKYLKTKEPNRFRTYCGWIGVDKSAAENMSDDDWLALMRKYKDNSKEWDLKTPTLTGISIQFKQQIQSAPTRYVNLILAANNDQNVNIAYVLSGFDGLTQAKDVDREIVHNVFQKIVNRFYPDINVFGSAPLTSFLRSLKFFINNKYLPDDVFDFICKAVSETNEDDDANNENDKEPYQTGINRARGIAGELLVDCSTVGKQYGDKIFNTLESIASSASITTRAAILINMARLNTIDPERSLTIFLHLMHDYKANLMALPVHNLNPLIYYINYGFAKLIPLFREAIKKSECHKSMTEILWLAFVKEKDGAENLFHQIILASHDAALTFFKVVARYGNYFPISKSMKYIVELIDKGEEDVSKNVSIVYDGYRNWSDEELEELTNAFVKHNSCIYTTHSYYECLKSYAVEHPEKVLQWIIDTYQWKKKKSFDPFEIQRILEILAQSYNGVRKYYPEDEDIENAMDVMDEILADSQKRDYLRNFLFELDNF